MADRMRVAITLEQCWHRVPGGTATSILDLVRALDRRSDLEVVGVSAHHSEPPNAPFVPPKSAPLVVTIHDLAFLADASQATKHGNRFFRRGLDLTRRDADLVLVPSEATRAECLDAGIPAERLRVVPWGVDLVAVTDEQRADVRRRFGLDQPYVLFCGTLEPRKNLAGLVEAFAGLAKARPNLDLVLVGPDGWNEDLGARIEASGLGSRAKPLGFVADADKHALYAEAAAFCYPSLREGFGLPVLEALAQGAPVVTSSGTATEEVAGGAALVVDPRDPSAIEAALARILDEPEVAADLASKGPARAGELTWDASAEATAAAYAEVVG